MDVMDTLSDVLVDVSEIISSVLASLTRDKTGTRRFIYVEVAFLKIWWEDHSDSTRQALVQLVNNGRLVLHHTNTRCSEITLKR